MVNEVNDFCKTLGLGKFYSLLTWDRALRRSCLRVLVHPEEDAEPTHDLSTERFDREYAKLKRAAAEQRKELSKIPFTGGAAAHKQFSNAQYAKHTQAVLDGMLNDT